MSIKGKKDETMATKDSKPIYQHVEGVKIRYAHTHADTRGTLVEAYADSWEFHDAPLVSVTVFSINPGKIKGWIKHLAQDDRLFLHKGFIKVVLYDDRPDSPTTKTISEIVITENNRALILIPMGVYHAIQNIGTKEAIILDMPTKLYAHENPDKYRLPPTTDKIPYEFKDTWGW